MAISYLPTRADSEEGALTPSVVRDVLAAVSVASIPDVTWILGDDLCDCTFQRIGEWTNPYIARTLRVRFCCIWTELYKQYPQFVQDIPGYYDENRHRFVTEPRAWDSEEMAMPLYLWHRQLASLTGQSVGTIRDLLKDSAHERPQALAPGTAEKDEPTDEEVQAALNARLRAATWLLPEESI